MIGRLDPEENVMDDSLIAKEKQLLSVIKV